MARFRHPKRLAASTVVAGRNKIVYCVPVPDVPKRDQRVIGYWDTDGIGLEGSSLKSIPLQIAS